MTLSVPCAAIGVAGASGFRYLITPTMRCTRWDAVRSFQVKISWLNRHINGYRTVATEN